MTRTGTIKLIYRDFETVQKDYKSPGDRKKIIESWRIMYAEKFKECSIQIRPDVYEHKKYDTSKRLTQLV